MTGFVKRDPLWTGPVLKWTVLGALNSGLVCTFIISLARWFGGWGLTADTFRTVLALLIWWPLAFLFLLGGFRERCTEFDVSLPIEARRLWRRHVVAAFLAGSTFVLSTVGVLGICFWALGRAGWAHNNPLPSATGLLLPSLSTLLLVIVLLQRSQPAMRRISPDRAYCSLAVAAFLAGYALVVLLSMPRAPVFLIVLTFAIVLAVRTERSVPPSFLIAPREPKEVDEAKAPSAELEPLGAAPPSRFSFYLLLTRITFQALSKNRFALAVVYAFLFPWGLLLSGFLGMKLGWSEELDLYNTTLTLYTLVATLGAPLARLYVLDPLPVSRKYLFAFVVLPPLLILSAGYTAGRIGMRTLSAPAPSIEFTREAAPGMFPSYPLDYPTVRVSSRFSRIAWDGEVPDNGSPWGESHAPWKTPLFRGSRITLYSPFSTPEDCSADFVALQLSRAAREIYGADISPGDLRARYLMGTDTGVELREGGLSLLHDYAGLRAPAHVTFFPMLAVVVFVAWLALCAVYLRTFRASISEAVRKATLIALFVVTMAVHIGLLLSFITRFMRSEAASAFWRVITVKTAAALPGGELGLWALCALLFAAAYGLVQSAFERIEMPAPQGRPAE